MKIAQRKIGDFETINLSNFFAGFVNGARMNLHIVLPYGKDPHHKVEACFKAFGKAMRMACSLDKTLEGDHPEHKGGLMIVIIDYGAGNLQSVKNALDRLGVPSLITDDKEAILKADKVIFPGQGHFGACVAALKEKGLFEVIREVACTKPFLGICVGMQLLFESK